MNDTTLPLVQLPERPTIDCQRLLFRNALLDSGHTPSSIRHRLCSGMWRRLFDGVYLDLAEPPEVQQHAHVVGALARCGPGSALGAETAAAWHGFDSTKVWGSSPLVIVQPRENKVPLLEGITVRRPQRIVDTVKQEIQRIGHDQRMLQQSSHQLVGSGHQFRIEPRRSANPAGAATQNWL